MIGKTLYKAKIRDDEIIIESNTIVEEGRKLYHFDEKHNKSCRIDDVGIVIFRTEKAAIAFLVGQLEHSVECGERYLKKTKQQLKEANALLFPEKEKTDSIGKDNTK